MKRAADTVIERIEELQTQCRDLLVVALDGQSGVGKTTIAKQIVDRIDAANVFCNDFVDGSNEFWAGQTPQEQIDNAIDWRRIKQEVAPVGQVCQLASF